MEKDRLHINTGLKGFVVPDRICAVSEDKIAGLAEFNDSPPFLAIEALAQLGAFHGRYLCGFEKHVFLLKVDHFSIFDCKNISGSVELSGALRAKSQTVFAHNMSAKRYGKLIFFGEFLFAASEYDDNFQREKLKQHYKRTFECLSALKNG